MKYDSLSDYLDALEQRIELVSAGNEILRLDLQKDIAMERLMARFDPAKSAVKGGFGVRTLVPGGPLTQDLDILIDNVDWQGLTKERIYQLVGDYVLEQMATEGPDKFKFTPTSAAPFSDMGPEQAAVRIWAQVSVGGKSFGAVIIDAGLKDQSVPVENHTGRDVLGFAEVENPIITTPSREWLTADKLTLLLENRWEGDRPRDAVHGALLLEEGRYNQAVLAQWLEKFARSRGVSALLTIPLAQPSKTWTMQVNQICSRNGIMMTAETCFERISGVFIAFLDAIASTIDGALSFATHLSVFNHCLANFFYHYKVKTLTICLAISLFPKSSKPCGRSPDRDCRVEQDQEENDDDTLQEVLLTRH